MKIAIFDTYYDRFLEALNRERDARAASDRESYADRLDALIRARMGTSDFYSRHLRALGHDARDFVVNDSRLQGAWADDRGLRLTASLDRLARRKAGGALRRLTKAPMFWPFLERCAIEQARKFRPDVVYVQDMGFFSPSALRALKATGALLVGQIACPLPIEAKVREFDLIVTSFPHYVKRLRAGGMKSEYLRIAFDPSVLEAVGPRARDYGAVFVGGLGGRHRPGLAAIEKAAHRVSIDVWGYGVEELADGSALKARYRGEAWALGMYEVLARAQIAVNRHIDVAENYANNMRLFEATGMGAMLVTDAKDNLAEMFEPGREVVVYRNADELADALAHYLARPDEARAIADAGHRRTMREHLYEHRMRELAGILERALREKGRLAR